MKQSIEDMKRTFDFFKYFHCTLYDLRNILRIRILMRDWQDKIDKTTLECIMTYFGLTLMALQQQLFQRISPTAVILCKINDRFLWNMLRLILLNQASYSQSFSLGMLWPIKMLMSYYVVTDPIRANLLLDSYYKTITYKGYRPGFWEQYV